MQLGRGIGGKAFFTVTGPARRGRGRRRRRGRRAGRGAGSHDRDHRGAARRLSSPSCARARALPAFRANRHRHVGVLVRRHARAAELAAQRARRRRQPGQRRRRGRARAGRRHQPLRDRARLRHQRGAAGQGAGAPPARRVRAADQAASRTKIPRSSRRNSKNRSRCSGWTTIDLLSLHGLNSASDVDWRCGPAAAWRGGKVPPRRAASATSASRRTRRRADPRRHRRLAGSTT